MKASFIYFVVMLGTVVYMAHGLTHAVAKLQTVATTIQRGE